MTMDMLSLLRSPLWEEAPVTWGQTGLLLLAVVTLSVGTLLLLLGLVKEKKRKSAPVQSDPVQPAPPPPLPTGSTVTAPRQRRGISVGNLQGLGQRDSQQDAFGFSSLDREAEQGLFALVCDGMGGMQDGGAIARAAADKLRLGFVFDPSRPDRVDDCVRALLEAVNRETFSQYNRKGGTTVVAVHIWKGAFRFWSVGDSDIFLLRRGELCAVNQRQEYENDLLLEAVRGEYDPMDALHHPQAGALSSFIGDRSLRIDAACRPIPLEPGDKLLLCSDGVSDTLSPAQLEEALAAEPTAACELLEQGILAADKSSQDNYTAIILEYDGE